MNLETPFSGPKSNQKPRVNQLFACSNVNYSPDGKNILCILKQQEIEKLLG